MPTEPLIVVRVPWICKHAVWSVAEALECLGGNGYVEESGMPRLYREAPLNSIWEGSGNVNSLDVLRAMARMPGAMDAFFAELELGLRVDARFDAYVATLRGELAQADEIAHRARRLVERMALALQGALLMRHGEPAVADAFCASRLAGNGGRAHGTLPVGIDVRRIVERHAPRVS